MTRITCFRIYTLLDIIHRPHSGPLLLKYLHDCIAIQTSIQFSAIHVDMYN